MTDNLSIFLAFAAGLLSFLSPCVLPLIPSYLCFLGGMSRERTRGQLVSGTVSFILGFTAVFVCRSVLMSSLFFMLGGPGGYINRIAGAVVILLGLNILFDFLPFLNREFRFHIESHIKRDRDPAANKRPGTGPGRIVGAFLTGAAFGAGWTPCVGPILGSILLLAGQSGRTGLAVLYLVSYSLGLGLPFLGAAIFFDRFLKYAVKLRSRLPLIQRISGVLLIVIGTLIVLGRFQFLTTLILEGQSRFIRWALEGGPLPRYLPAGLLLLAAALPLAAALRSRRVPGRGLLIFCGIAGILALVQAAGLIDCAGGFAQWLLLLQNV
jgi:cytochrome c-type biogenesis protein